MDEYTGRRRAPITRRRALAGTGGGLLAAGLVGAVVTDGYQSVRNRLFSDGPSPEVAEVSRDANLPLEVEQWFAGVVVPQDVTEGPPGPTDVEIVAWADELGGIAASGTTFVLQVTSPQAAVLVTSLVPRVLERSSPSAGRVVPPSGAGNYWQRALRIDLDMDLPTSQPYSDDTGDWDFPISMGNGDNLIVELIGETTKHTARWCVDIHYLVDGEGRVITFPDESDPFVTTSTSATTSFWVWGSGWTSGTWP